MQSNSEELHVFIVHSPITATVVKSIIRFLSLRSDQILVLRMRDAQFSPEFESVIFKDFKSTGLFNFFSNRKKLIHFDKWIETATRSHPFKAYIPHHLHSTFILLSGHKNCIEYNYVEEGLSSYIHYHDALQSYKNKSSNRIRRMIFKMLNSLSYGVRLPSDQPIYNFEDYRYNKSFGLFDYSFPDFLNRQTVEPQFDSLESIPDSIDYVLVIGVELETGYVKEGDFFEFYEVFLELYSQICNDKTLHYKFHPEQSLLVKEKLVGTIQFFGITAEQLDNSTDLESLAQRSKPTFFTFVSSIGFYAALMDCKVISFLHLLDKTEDLISKIKLLPSLYFLKINHPNTILNLKNSLTGLTK